MIAAGEIYNREESVIRVLFVCTGNICRSPIAEAVFRSLVKAEGLSHMIMVDSAGTTDFHMGEAPDPRASAVAHRRGIHMNDIRARCVLPDDYHRFDYILAMDRENLERLRARGSRLGVDTSGGRLRLFMDFAPDCKHSEVPDPYYGGRRGFELVLDLIETASRGLLAEIRHRRL